MADRGSWRTGRHSWQGRSGRVPSRTAGRPGPDSSIDPCRMGRLPGLDRRQAAEQVAELVRARDEHRLRERVDVERKVFVRRQMDDLCLEIDGQLGIRVARDEIEQLAMTPLL